jgi:hypothetical protein
MATEMKEVSFDENDRLTIYDTSESTQQFQMNPLVPFTTGLSTYALFSSSQDSMLGNKYAKIAFSFYTFMGLYAMMLRSVDKNFSIEKIELIKNQENEKFSTEAVLTLQTGL